MDKRTVVAGGIVLAIGLVLQLIALNFGYSTGLVFKIVTVSIIIGYLLIIAGIIMLIYGAIRPDPPVHYDNNL
jgi:hypothetical protein